MAAISRPRAGRGGSPIALIIFIILTVAGIAGCYFLYVPWQDATKSLRILQDDIQANIEQPLKEKGVQFRLQDKRQYGGVMYGKDFFETANKALRSGLKYDNLLLLVGWPDEEEVKKKLDSTEKKSPHLASLIQYYENEIRELRTGLAQAQRSREAAEKERQVALDAKEKTRKDKQAEIDAAQRELTKLRQDHDAAVAKLKKEVETVDKQRQDIKGKLDAQENARQAAEAKLTPLNDEIGKLKKRIQDLEKPVVKRVVKEERQGRVLETNLASSLVYIDLGKADNVEEGARFRVYEVGEGGKEKTKGEIEVKRVNPTTSTAGVVQQNRLNPIIKGDHVARCKAPQTAAAPPAPPAPAPKSKAETKPPEAGAK
ncbi:MAG: hypothetical protein FJ279_09985 [Planctomycetes bacterium]|nr:hypothetical protein [Planctomycetota bacterium]